MFQSYIMIFSDFILEIKKKKREKWIACVVHEYEIGFEGSQILFDVENSNSVQLWNISFGFIEK